MTNAVLLRGLTLVCALGCGLVAGALFAFSVLVMPALRRLPAVSGVAAMQQINIVAMEPAFSAVFLGAMAACLLAVMCALVSWRRAEARWILAGGLLYLLGTFAVTVAVHVPLNYALAKTELGSSESVALWANYLATWTLWNHVRVVAAVAALAAFIFSLKR